MLGLIPAITFAEPAIKMAVALTRIEVARMKAEAKEKAHWDGMKREIEKCTKRRRAAFNKHIGIMQ